MKILYDHQIFSSFRYSGISRYYCELFAQFDAMGIEWRVSTLFSNNRSLDALRPQRRFLDQLEFRGKNRLLESLNLLATEHALRRGDFDVFHSTYSKPYAKEKLGGRPYVITVHDMTHEHHPELPSAARESAEERVSIARADWIITPSESTRDDLVSLYPEAAHKVSVIYHGVTPAPVIERPAFLPERYVLHVGTRALYRDFDTALRALARLPQGLPLVAVGGGDFTPAELARFTELNLNGRVHHFALNEAELFAAYRHAAALIFPSRSEGFGLPVIEAQHEGCIPVLSDTPTFREIGGDAALFFAPGDDAGAAEALSLLLNDETAKRELQSAAAVNMRRFDWRRAAEATTALYRQLTGK